MSKHACFMIEDTGIARQFLRRYVSSLKASCPLAFGYHDALVPFDMAPAKLEAWHPTARGQSLRHKTLASLLDVSRRNGAEP